MKKLILTLLAVAALSGALIYANEGAPMPLCPPGRCCNPMGGPCLVVPTVAHIR